MEDMTEFEWTFEKDKRLITRLANWRGYVMGGGGGGGSGNRPSEVISSWARLYLAQRDCIKAPSMRVTRYDQYDAIKIEAGLVEMDVDCYRQLIQMRYAYCDDERRIRSMLRIRGRDFGAYVAQSLTCLQKSLDMRVQTHASIRTNLHAS
jgi:hypothetical protein